MDSTSVQIFIIFGITLVLIVAIIWGVLRASKQKTLKAMEKTKAKHEELISFEKSNKDRLESNKNGMLDKVQVELMPGFLLKKGKLSSYLIKNGNKFVGIDEEKISKLKIESGYGKCYFDIKKKMFVVICNGRKMELLFGLLKPGTYQFYYLPEFQLIISAEPCDATVVQSFNSETESLTATLKQLIKFKTEDIKENRKGLLSKNQKKKFLQPLIIRVSVITLLLLGNFALIYSVSEYTLLPLSTIIIIVLLPSIKKIVSDIRENTILSVTGYGWQHPYGSESNLTSAFEILVNFLGDMPNAIFSFWQVGEMSKKHKYQIGDRTFEVSHTIWSGLGEGWTYKAYYSKATNQLLSVEVI